jgi:hypothetical protein
MPAPATGRVGAPGGTRATGELCRHMAGGLEGARALFGQRLGRVAAVAGLTVVACSLSACGAEHAGNTGFATIGDSSWWGS